MKEKLQKFGNFLKDAGRAVCALFAVLLLVPLLMFIDEDELEQFD